MTISLALVAFAGYLSWHGKQPAFYETPTGERRVVVLSDGSQLFLDARTLVTVRYTYDGRKLAVLRGHARFDATQDAARPFAVFVGTQRVVAANRAAFDAELRGRQILITLIEGNATVYDHSERSSEEIENSVARAAPNSPATSRAGVELKAGQQLQASRDAPPRSVTADVNRVTAWQNGRIYCDDETLSSVLERLNRYVPIPLSVGNTPTANLRVTAMFDIDEPDGLLPALLKAAPIRSEPLGNRGIRLFAR